MKNEKKNCYEKSKSGSSQVKGTLTEELKRIAAQIDAKSFKKSEQAQVIDLAMIMAEIKLLPDDALVRIAGNDLPVGLVSEIYDKIENDHIRMVLSKFKKVNYEVRHLKTYHRTALYNSVFEIESRIENELNESGLL